MEGFVGAVVCVLVRGDRVLAMRRSAWKDVGAGIWETVSGRLEPGEQPLDAIAREVIEETGLRAEINPDPVDAYVAMRGEHPMLVVVYRGDVAADGTLSLSVEHDAHAWSTVEELRVLGMPPRLLVAVERALRVTPRARAVPR